MLSVSSWRLRSENASAIEVVRQAAPELVLLAGDEVAPLLDDAAVQLVHQGRLADARVAGHQQKLGGSVRDAGPGLHEGPEVALPAVELVGDAELVGAVGGAELQLADLPVVFQPTEAGGEVVGHAGGALVPVLGVLGEQPQGDVAEGVLDLRPHLAGRLRGLRDVGVHHLHGVVGGEGGPAREQVVERGAEAVEVGPPVDGPVHAPGLLGRDVGQVPGEPLGVHRRAGLPRDPGGLFDHQRVEIAVAGGEERLRVDLPVHEATAVELLEELGDAGREPDRLHRGEAVGRHQRREQFASRIGAHDRGGRVHAEAPGVDSRVFDIEVGEGLGDPVQSGATAEVDQERFRAVSLGGSADGSRRALVQGRRKTMSGCKHCSSPERSPSEAPPYGGCLR